MDLAKFLRCLNDPLGNSRLSLSQLFEFAVMFLLCLLNCYILRLQNVVNHVLAALDRRFVTVNFIHDILQFDPPLLVDGVPLLVIALKFV